MAKQLSSEELIEQIEGMSVLDLANLVKDLEEKFGVSAAAMAAPVAVAGGGAAAGEGDAGEQDSFDVVLTTFGDKKINVIKMVREVTSLGLKEAKELVDNLPKPVKEGVEQGRGRGTQGQVRGRWRAGRAQVSIDLTHWIPAASRGRGTPTTRRARTCSRFRTPGLRAPLQLDPAIHGALRTPKDRRLNG